MRTGHHTWRVRDQTGRQPHIARGQVYEQRYLHPRLVLAGHQMSRPPHLPPRTFKVHREASTGISLILGSSINTLFSQGYILGTAPAAGMVGGTYVPRTGEGVGNLPLPGIRLGSISSHVLSMNFSNTNVSWYNHSVN